MGCHGRHRVLSTSSVHGTVGMGSARDTAAGVLKGQLKISIHSRIRLSLDRIGHFW